MQKTYIIYSSDGVEVIDSRKNAEAFVESMDFAEEKYNRELKLKHKKQSFAQKILSVCGLL